MKTRLLTRDFKNMTRVHKRLTIQLPEAAHHSYQFLKGSTCPPVRRTLLFEKQAHRMKGKAL